MRLSTEQLDLIDQYLEQIKLDFLDFKIEVKDHLACQIENKIQLEKTSFEIAFDEVIQNWNEDFNKTKTWIVSNEREFPALVLKKIKNKVIVHYSTVIVLALVLCVGYLYLKDDFIPSHNYLRFIIGFCGVSYLFLRNIMNRTKHKTSYRFHFDYFYINTMFTFVLLFVFNLNVNFSIVFALILLADFPFSIYYFIKHRKFIKKHQLV